MRNFSMSLISTVLYFSTIGIANANEKPSTLPIEPLMKTLPGGQFSMGTDGEVLAGRAHQLQPIKTSSPARQVSIKPFRMGMYEVTVKEFSRFVAATNYAAPTSCIQMASKEWFDKIDGSWAGNKHSTSEFEPVTCIGFEGAKAYTIWLAKVTGKKYRLPTEAEWEYAAKANTTGTFYWGEEADRAKACTFANVADRSAEAAIKRDYEGLESINHIGVLACDDQSDYASIVGMYQANAFGLHDMIGNINEFVEDCFTRGYENAPIDGSARLDGDCKKRVLRGGSWHWPVQASIQRGSTTIDFIGSLEGFRIVEEISETASKQASRTEKLSAQSSSFQLALKAAQNKERQLRSGKAKL
jgi:formylglycine-generating enzyme required for sulfatase activity